MWKFITTVPSEASSNTRLLYEFTTSVLPLVQFRVAVCQSFPPSTRLIPQSSASTSHERPSAVLVWEILFQTDVAGIDLPKSQCQGGRIRFEAIIAVLPIDKQRIGVLGMDVEPHATPLLQADLPERIHPVRIVVHVVVYSLERFLIHFAADVKDRPGRRPDDIVLVRIIVIVDGWFVHRYVGADVAREDGERRQ